MGRRLCSGGPGRARLKCITESISAQTQRGATSLTRLPPPGVLAVCVQGTGQLFLLGDQMEWGAAHGGRRWEGPSTASSPGGSLPLLVPALVSCGRPSKSLQTVWLDKRKWIFSLFWWPEAPGQAVGGVLSLPPEASAPLGASGRPGLPWQGAMSVPSRPCLHRGSLPVSNPRPFL